MQTPEDHSSPAILSDSTGSSAGDVAPIRISAYRAAVIGFRAMALVAAAKGFTFLLTSMVTWLVVMVRPWQGWGSVRMSAIYLGPYIGKTLLLSLPFHAVLLWFLARPLARLIVGSPKALGGATGLSRWEVVHIGWTVFWAGILMAALDFKMVWIEMRMPNIGAMTAMAFGLWRHLLLGGACIVGAVALAVRARRKRTSQREAETADWTWTCMVVLRFLAALLALSAVSDLLFWLVQSQPEWTRLWRLFVSPAWLTGLLLFVFSGPLARLAWRGWEFRFPAANDVNRAWRVAEFTAGLWLLFPVLQALITRAQRLSLLPAGNSSREVGLLSLIGNSLELVACLVVGSVCLIGWRRVEGWAGRTRND